MRRAVMLLVLALGLVACGEDVVPLPERPTITPGAATAATAVSTATAAPEPTQPSEPTATPETGAAQPAAPSQPLLIGVDAPAEVKLVQQRLLELGYDDIGEVDGIFGAKTDGAVRMFQRFQGLTVDGVVGVDTWTALFGAEAVPYSIGIEQVPPFGGLGYLAPDGLTIRRRDLLTSQERDLATLQINPSDTIWKLVADPTGSYFAVQSGEFNDLSIYYADGTLRATYSGMTDFQWSPDGQYFSIFLGDINRPAVEVWRTERDDEEGPVVDIPGWRSGWLPDSSGLVVAQDTALIAYDLATGTERTLAAIDRPWEIDTLLPTDGGVFFYTGLSEERGTYGGGKQLAVVSMYPEAPGCAQNGFGCGEIIPITDPNGNLIDEAFFAQTDNVLVFAENARFNACVSEEMLSVMLPVSDAVPQTAPLPTDLGDGFETKGAALPPGSGQLYYAIQSYTCGDTALNYGPAAIYSWNFYDPNAGALTKVVDGAFPFWIQ